MSSPSGPYAPGLLPAGARSRMVDGVNGLTMHILEAGFEEPSRPLVVLLHGFPELAFSWRKLLAPLAGAGYHVVAPDLRGYGRTAGADVTYGGDLASYRRLNVVRDVFGLVSALGYRSVAAVVGHDHGSPLAAWCAVTRPDIFRLLVMMSAPFGGTPAFPFTPAAPPSKVDEELAALDPPRKHYARYYYQLREANEDMWHAPQGIHAFLRGYYHMKSADWAQNTPFRLANKGAAAMAVMPRYYIMDRDKGMAATVAEEMPSEAEIAANRWLPEDELSVYSDEYGRTGFQGGLQWYRAGGLSATELELYAGRRIEQPAMFIAGASDWGTYQGAGSLERMQESACANFQGVDLIPGAGHWVQQEQSEAVAALLTDFLRRNTGAAS